MCWQRAMTDVQALFEAGRAAWMRNDLTAAEADLSAALAGAPGNPTIRAALGAVVAQVEREVAAGA
jgi:Flp pilus assembly protein TadD